MQLISSKPWDIDPSRFQGNVFVTPQICNASTTFLFSMRFTHPLNSCILLFLRHCCIPCSFHFPLTLVFVIVCWLWIGCALSSCDVNSKTSIVSTSVFAMQLIDQSWIFISYLPPLVWFVKSPNGARELFVFMGFRNSEDQTYSKTKVSCIL